MLFRSIFSKFDFVVNKLNTKFFGFDIYELDTLQYTIYDEEGSHYNWHWDINFVNDLQSSLIHQRKLSAVLQLADKDEYDGGDLLLATGGPEICIPKKKGYMTIFPSFILHKVEPVSKGSRRTLVGWFKGPDWR